MNLPTAAPYEIEHSIASAPHYRRIMDIAMTRNTLYGYAETWERLQGYNISIKITFPPKWGGLPDYGDS